MRGTRTTGQGLGTLGAEGKFMKSRTIYIDQSSLFDLVLGEEHLFGHTQQEVPYPSQTGSQEHKNMLRRPCFLYKKKETSLLTYPEFSRRSREGSSH